MPTLTNRIKVCQRNDTTNLWNKIQQFTLQIFNKWQGLNFLTPIADRIGVKQKINSSSVLKIFR
jgi:hypothetical protein